MNAADRRRLTPMLGVLAVLLLLLLVALWLGVGRGVHWHATADAPRLPPTDAALPPPKVAALDHFAAVWQHPLFSPDRMPEAPAGSGNGSSGDLVLTGVIMLPGLNMAIVHDKTSGKDYRVREGQPGRNGPELVTLHPRSAVVDSAGSRLQLRLIPGAGSGSDAADAGGDAPAPAADAPQPVQKGTSPRSAAAARARELRKQLEARRRRNRQNGGD